MTARGYRLRPAARRALVQIFDYTESEYGRLQAEKYLQGLRESFGHLARFPNMAPAATPGSAVRIALFRRHRIFYRVGEDGIVIGAILHQAQDFARTLARLQRTSDG